MPRRVPKRDGVHAAQIVRIGEVLDLKEMHGRFAIRQGVEPVRPLEGVAQLGRIIDLAIGRQHRALFPEQGLVARDQINDGQAVMGQSKRAGQEATVMVRTAMVQGPFKGGEQGWIDRLAVLHEDAADSAHAVRVPVSPQPLAQNRGEG